MTGKEKLYFLLDVIDDARVITPTGQPVKIHPLNDLNNNYTHIELEQLFAKLEQDEQILKVLKTLPTFGGGLYRDLDPYLDPDDGCYHLEILVTFDKYFSKIQQEAEYQKFTGKSFPAEEVKTKSSSTYEVQYSNKTRKILINGFLLKQPRSFGDNEAIFSYLYENPNQDKSVKDITEGTGLDSIKSLNKFVENIGFTGELRKVFFKVSKGTIRFNNPITEEDLRELGIEYLKLG